MGETRFTYTKGERLTNKTIIDELFTNGHSFVSYPFRIVWNQAELNSDFPAQFVVSVSKRCFKRAVKRNLLKRRIREIYRQNKHLLYHELKEKEIQIAFMVVYLPKTILPSSELEPKLKKALQKIPKEYEKSNPVHNDPTD